MYFIQSSGDTAFHHETIIRTGITAKKIPLYKFIEYGMILERDSYIKKQKYFSLLDYQLRENFILGFGLSQKDNERDNSELVTKFVGMFI